MLLSRLNWILEFNSTHTLIWHLNRKNLRVSQEEKKGEWRVMEGRRMRRFGRGVHSNTRSHSPSLLPLHTTPNHNISNSISCWSVSLSLSLSLSLFCFKFINIKILTGIVTIKSLLSINPFSVLVEDTPGFPSLVSNMFCFCFCF